MSGQRFYEEGEAEEILRRAVQTSHSGSIDRDHLLSMAAELGISEQALARAEAEVVEEKEATKAARREAQDRKEYHRWRRREFWTSDFSSAVMASLVFTALWFFTGRGYFWPGWIIGIAALVTVMNLIGEVLLFSESDYQRWKRKRDRKQAGLADDEEVDAFVAEIMPVMGDRKIEAIREVREKFGLDLRDAKEAVDRYLPED